jgi:hypothetical protein
MPCSNLRIDLPIGEEAALDRREISSIHFDNLLIVLNLYNYFNLYNLLNFSPRELQKLAPNCGALEENSLISWISSKWSDEQIPKELQPVFLGQGLAETRSGWSA